MIKVTKVMFTTVLM